ncbi:hypothetical protein PsorP6_009260 [Peronosclerospora sorghi]|uniref:Uncharacterized protein n=1 Tax=Peronosclerospora sorghi TaxID=230839 RepID=A0ACC0VYQ5_9STRA|nr:hypothetical protein PsorP6_009260 [Peronosclerospora sorghi]
MPSAASVLRRHNRVRITQSIDFQSNELNVDAVDGVALASCMEWHRTFDAKDSRAKSPVPGNEASKYGKTTMTAWRESFFKRLRRHAARVCRCDHKTATETVITEKETILLDVLTNAIEN